MEDYPPDDYDLEGDASFSGPSPTQVDQGAHSQELIVRELGATVLEEIHHNR